MRARSIGLTSACLVAFMATTGAQAQTWRMYSSAVDGFEVEFSGDVKAEKTNLSADAAKKMVRSTNYQQEGGAFSYNVGATLVKGDLNFDNGVKSSYGVGKCKTTTSDKPLPFPSGRAREITGTGCLGGEMRIDTRYFTVGKWFYQVIAIYQAKGDDEKAARHFVESFKVKGK
jgi:hypothetical protein